MQHRYHSIQTIYRTISISSLLYFKSKLDVIVHDRETY